MCRLSALVPVFADTVNSAYYDSFILAGPTDGSRAVDSGLDSGPRSADSNATDFVSPTTPIFAAE